MKNKKNLLIYPKNINFEFLGLEFMRLHKHGQGIISRSRCSHSIEKHGFPMEKLHVFVEILIFYVKTMYLIEKDYTNIMQVCSQVLKFSVK